MAKLSSVHSAMLSVHFFLCLPLLLPPRTVSWRMVFDRHLALVTCSHQRSFLFFTVVSSSSWRFACLVMVGRTFSFVVCSIHEMPSTLLKHLISTAWIFLCSSVVCVYIKIDRTNQYCNFSLEERLVCLSRLMGSCLAGVAVVCAALARTSVFEPSSLRTAPRYLN